jgi:hypothetical protein
MEHKKMTKFLSAILITFSTILAGCAGTSATVKSQYHLVKSDKLELLLNTPPEAKEEAVTIFKDRLMSRLSSNELLAGPGDTSSKTLEVTVTHYYMRPGAARALVGLMAGVDNIESTVTIKDRVSGNTLSEYTVESSNPSAWGTSRGLIEDHADEIVKTLTEQ